MINKKINPITLEEYIKTQDANVRLETFRFDTMPDALITDILPQYLETQEVQLNDKEKNKYKSNPKGLSYDIYKSTDLWFIICVANDTARSYEFAPDDIIKLPTSKAISNIIFAFNNLKSY